MYSSIICSLRHSFCISGNHNIHILGYAEKAEINNNLLHIPELIKGLCDIKMIDCGFEHILCLDFYGNVFSFGTNYHGQLGLGKDRGELEETNIPQRVNIPSCKQIACGIYFSMCLTEEGLLYSFGSNGSGECGLESSNEYHVLPQLIPNFDNVEYIACGNYFSICKRYNNTYYGWGSNYYGQLGHIEYRTYFEPTLCNNYPGDIISIKCSESSTLLLTLKGNIYSFGNNEYGQLGLNDYNIKKTSTPTLIRNIPEIRRIECGYNHSMCIDVNDDLWIFGENNYGQLGLGDNKPIYKPISHPTLSNIMDISSRGYSTFVKTVNHKIYAFGSNAYSKLGIVPSLRFQLTPAQLFQDNENIWCSFIGKSKQKSARK